MSPVTDNAHVTRDKRENAHTAEALTRDILLAQLEAVQADKDRLWQEKEEAIRQWRDLFAYIQNLQADRKLLVAGQDQEWARLVEEHQQAQDALKAVLRRQRLVTKGLAWVLVLVVTMAGLAGLHAAGVVKVDLAALARASVVDAP